MIWFYENLFLAQTKQGINYNILIVTVVFGALALFFSTLSIAITFWLSYRKRQENYKQTIMDNADYLLKNLKTSFNDIGESIFYKNNLGLKRAIDSFDVFATLTWDELNPKFFATEHTKAEFRVYRKLMERMTKNGLPLAIDRYNAMLGMSKNNAKNLNSNEANLTRERLNQYLKDSTPKIEKKQRLMEMLNNHPDQVWAYAQRELAQFRLILETVWVNLVEGYRKYEKSLNSRKSESWKEMADLYYNQEANFYQFRGTLQSLFIN